jgi:hypothetical protein
MNGRLWSGDGGRTDTFLSERSSFFNYKRFLNFNGDDCIVSVRIWLWLVSDGTQRLEQKAQQQMSPEEICIASLTFYKLNSF